MRRFGLSLTIMTVSLVALALPASAARPVTGVTMVATYCDGGSADVEAVLKVAPNDAKRIIGGEVVFTWYSVYEGNAPNEIDTETVAVTRRVKLLKSGPNGLATGYSFSVTAVGSTSGAVQAFSVTSPTFTVDGACT